MELKISGKYISVATAAILACSALIPALVKNAGVSAVEDKTAQTEAVTEIPEATDVIIPTENPDDEESITSWWKADLSEYNEDMSLISYETVEVPTEAATEPQENGVLVNDTGVSYVDGNSNYQSIEIVPSSDTTRPDTTPTGIESGNFAFTTYGYGHGVGMSQNGANFYASYSGWDYKQILTHYYPGTTVQGGGKTDITISAGEVSGSVTDIVSMVTYNEVGSTMNNEAIKAQAVAIYTYILYKGGAAPDLYPKPNPPQNVVDAVKSVLGEGIYYNGEYILAMFGASSAGNTASSYDVFYGDIPYLRSVPSEYDSTYDPHYGTVEVISAEEVKADLEAAFGVTLSDNPENWISVTEGDGGYASTVTIDNQVTTKGDEFRISLGLKSPNFTFAYYN